MPPALLWFRRDLRLADHAALHAAMAGGRAVVPFYLLDDETAGAWKPGGAQRWWLHHSLAALDDSLRARGSGLVLRRGRVAEQIPRLLAETGATEIHAGQPVEPWARDACDALVRAGVTLVLHRTTTLLDPGSVRTGTGGAYGVYTPFSRAARARYAEAEPTPAPVTIPTAPLPASDPRESWQLLPKHPDWATGFGPVWSPGEAGAQERLGRFVRGGLAEYDRQRNSPGIDGSSQLSPHLAFGEISPGQIWHAATAAGGGGLEVYQNELLWREFSTNLLWHHPSLPEAPLKREYTRFPFRDDPAQLHAWQRGETGLPIVDAGMRQLWRTGWMHNRVRMIVASFLIKHLLLDWRDGEAWFWDTLVDADLSSNAAQWQWVAGSGADAAPFFRIFNPVLQGEKFDTNGAYVRRWVPELARLPDANLHAPFAAPASALDAAGVTLGRTYPRPVIDLADGRRRALAALATISAGAAM